MCIRDRLFSSFRSSREKKVLHHPCGWLGLHYPKYCPTNLSVSIYFVYSLPSSSFGLILLYCKSTIKYTFDKIYCYSSGAQSKWPPNPYHVLHPEPQHICRSVGIGHMGLGAMTCRRAEGEPIPTDRQVPLMWYPVLEDRRHCLLITIKPVFQNFKFQLQLHYKYNVHQSERSFSISLINTVYYF